MKLLDRLNTALTRREKTPEELIRLGKNIESLWLSISGAEEDARNYLELLYYEQLSPQTLRKINSFLNIKSAYEKAHSSAKELISENPELAAEQDNFNNIWCKFRVSYNALLQNYQKRTEEILEVSPIGEE